MTADYTVEAVRTIRRNAGVVTRDGIAEALGWPVQRLNRVAAQHGIDLRLSVDRTVDAPFPRPDKDLPLRRGPCLPVADVRSETFTVCMRPASANALRQKAKERYARPARLLVDVFEAALARGWLDELAAAGAAARPTESGKAES